jgi:hypothetical protein
VLTRWSTPGCSQALNRKASVCKSPDEREAVEPIPYRNNDIMHLRSPVEASSGSGLDYLSLDVGIYDGQWVEETSSEAEAVLCLAATIAMHKNG